MFTKLWYLPATKLIYMLHFIHIPQKSTIEFLIAESNRKYPSETGGILVGKFEHETVVVSMALGPGPKAIHRRNNFIRDGSYSQEKLEEYISRTKGEFDYLGEWHSHPINTGPSVRDLVSIKEIGLDQRYAIKQPILGIAIRESIDSWQINFYKYIRGRSPRLAILELSDEIL